MNLNFYFTIFLFFLCQLCCPVLLCIGFDVEIGEERKEEDAEEKDEEYSKFGIVAICEEWKAAMDGEGDKLKELHACDVSLPPEIFLHLWPHRGHQVVEVHDNMDPHVQEHEEGRVSTTNILEKYPASDWHDGMVDHMKRGQLVVLLTKNKEEGVHEICELGDKIPPDNACCC